MNSTDKDTYDARRAALVARHDSGAREALSNAIVIDEYYDSCPEPDLSETLVTLAEQGWRLVRVDTSTATSAPATCDAIDTTSTDACVTASGPPSTTRSIGTSTSDGWQGSPDMDRLPTLPDDYWK